MKNIKNKEVTIEILSYNHLQEEVRTPKNVRYSKWILDACRIPDGQAYEYDQISKFLRIEKAIKAENDNQEIAFEDGDFEYIKKKVEKQGFTILQQEVLDYKDYIASIK